MKLLINFARKDASTTLLWSTPLLLLIVINVLDQAGLRRFIPMMLNYRILLILLASIVLVLVVRLLSFLAGTKGDEFDTRYREFRRLTKIKM